MNNPYIDYYQSQIGRGILGFRGLRHQRGYGFLTSLISKAIVPLFKTIKSVDPGNVVRAATDLLKGPCLTPGKPLADDIARIGATATGSFINSLQSGKGRKYKAKRKTRKPSVFRKPQKRKVEKPKAKKRTRRGNKRSKIRKAIDALGIL